MGTAISLIPSPINTGCGKEEEWINLSAGLARVFSFVCFLFS